MNIIVKNDDGSFTAIPVAPTAEVPVAVSVPIEVEVPVAEPVAVAVSVKDVSDTFIALALVAVAGAFALGVFSTMWIDGFKIKKQNSTTLAESQKVESQFQEKIKTLEAEKAALLHKAEEIHQADEIMLTNFRSHIWESEKALEAEKEKLAAALAARPPSGGWLEKLNNFVVKK